MMPQSYMLSADADENFEKKMQLRAENRYLI